MGRCPMKMTHGVTLRSTLARADLMKLYCADPVVKSHSVVCTQTNRRERRLTAAYFEWSAVNRIRTGKAWPHAGPNAADAAA